MPTDIDNLRIKINAESKKANEAIDQLVGKIDRLTTSLSKINGASLINFSSGVEKLGSAMQGINNIKTADFTRLTKNLTRLSTLDVSNLSNVSSDVLFAASAFEKLGKSAYEADQIGSLVKSISKLGNKSVVNAIDNIPKLAKAIRELMEEVSKSPKISENLVQMTNAVANLASQGNKVKSASDNLINGLDGTKKATKKASNGFKGLSSVIGKLYQTYYWIGNLFKFAKDSIKNTADYIEAYNYFDVSLGKIGSDWAKQYDKYGYENADAYAKSFSKRLTEKLQGLSGIQIDVGKDGMGLLTDTSMKNLGLNIQEVTQYASQLASVTNSIGQTGEVSLAAASAFTKLGADISSLFNIDYSTAMKNLQSGLIGQSRALYKYGIDITNATLQTYAYNLGLSKSISEMTQAEKMQIRMIAILDQSKVSWGDQSNTINSISNMFRQFANNVKEAGMVLGQLFIPILQKVMPVVNGVMIAIKRLLVSIAGLLGVKVDFGSFGTGYNQLEDTADTMDDVAAGYDKATASAKKYQNQILGFDEINKLTETETGGSSGGSGGVAAGIDLTDEILKATSEYEKAWKEAFDNMENQAQKWADRVSKLFKPILKIFKDFAVGDFFQAGQDVTDLVVSITDFFTTAIKKVNWIGIGKKIGQFFAGIDWIKILNHVGLLIWTAIEAAIKAWAGSFSVAPIQTVIITAFALFKWTKLGKVITAGFSKWFDSYWSKNISKPILDKMNELGKEIQKKVSTFAGSINEFLGSFGSSLPKFAAVGGVFTAIAAFIGIVSADKNRELKEFYKTNATGVLALEDVQDNLKSLNDEYNSFAKDTEKLDVLAGKYWELANKTSLTNEEQNLLIGYANQLVDDMPELADVIDTTTGKYTGQRDEVKKLIEKTVDYYKTLAYQDYIKKYTSELVELEMQQETNRKELEKNKEALEKIQSPLAEYNRGNITAAEFVKQTGMNVYTATRRCDEYRDAIEKDTEADKSYSGSIEDANEKIDYMQRKLDDTSTSLDNMGIVSQSVSSIVGKSLSGINFSGMGSNAGVSYGSAMADGIWSQKSKIKEAIDKIMATNIKIGGATNMLVRATPAYATGGFPEDGLFMANHSEIVGRFSNGRTAVANNDQITQGIAAAVAPAVYNAVMSAMINSNSSNGNNQMMYVEVKTQNDEVLARAVTRGQKKISRKLSPT